MMICHLCGESFTGRKRKYCTKACCLRAHGKNPDYKPEHFCLVCGKPLSEGQKKYCSGACNSKAAHRRKGGVSLDEYREKRKPLLSRKEKEDQQRHSLTDRIIKRHIYITLNRKEKGICKYNQITPKMIIETRAQILAWRDRRAKPKEIIAKSWYCKVCGKVMDSYHVYCSDECEKEQRRRESFQRNSAKKVLKERLCNECGEPFTPEYGNKRRWFCSDVCMVRHGNRNGKYIRRQRFKVAFEERVYKAQIYRRDGFRCQICKGKVNMKAKVPHPLAPTMDHIIALANGGKHKPSNVRLAHFICNSTKGDRATDGGDQLLLFG